MQRAPLLHAGIEPVLQGTRGPGARLLLGERAAVELRGQRLAGGHAALLQRPRGGGGAVRARAGYAARG